MARSGEATGYFCMTVIGIGYLFPIAAIWAAFDYWKMLFPDNNIEFAVTGVYQVGSVVTVAALSVSQSVALGPRILGGFSGQFFCLLAILGLRFLSVPADHLYFILLAAVALCSVATGYLDSALLALCSQYSSRMQEFLQIGIGFGTLVSVLYRDATKVVLDGQVSEATGIYFAVACVTVVFCVACYRLLMTLPISRHLRENGVNMAALLKNEYSTPPPSPSLASGFSGLQSPSRTVSRYDELRAAGLTVDVDAELPSDRGASFGTVYRIVWKHQLVIFLNMFLTTLCYPGVITSIPCRQFEALRAEAWFQTLLLTAFTFADIIARFLTNLRFGLSHRNIYLTVLVRVAAIPPLLYCAMSSDASDSLAFAMVAAFGFLNGLCVSLALIVVNEIPRLSEEQRKTCGRISACSVNSGLCVGSLAAAALASGLKLGA